MEKLIFSKLIPKNRTSKHYDRGMYYAPYIPLQIITAHQLNAIENTLADILAEEILTEINNEIISKITNAKA